MGNRTLTVLKAACIVVILGATYLTAGVFLPAEAGGSLAPAGDTLARATTSRGYLTTPEELQVIKQKADQGKQPYASAVKSVLSVAGQSWSYSLSAEARCPGADDPTWIDNDGGARLVYAKALAYRLTGDTHYASEVRDILQNVMTKVLTISTADNQCGLNFGWGTPEFVSAADLIEDYWKGLTCTGPLATAYGDNRIGSGNCKALFQNWLVKNPYYVVSYWAEKSLNNWGTSATTTIAYIADYLWDRPTLTLVHRNPSQVNGGKSSSFTPAQAYARANQLAITRMNGYRTDYHGSTSCDFLSGPQQSGQWAPVKSQITAAGIVPDDARRDEFCNVPRYTGAYQNYPQLHLGNTIQQCELMLRRGDASCYNNVDNTAIANYSYVGPDGTRRTTALGAGRGSIERGINAVIVDTGTDWKHDAALAVAYRYYVGHSRFGKAGQWASKITEIGDCGQDVCFGVLTHGLASGESPSNPPTVPPPGGGAPPPPQPSPTPAPTQAPITPTRTPAPTTPTGTPAPTATPVTTSQPPDVAPGALKFAPTDDAYVYGGYPNNNYATVTYLRARADVAEYRSYLKFNVSGVSGPVTRARLRIYAYDGSDTGGVISRTANTYANSSTAWTQSGLTFAKAPAVGAKLAQAGSVANNTWVEYDVTAAVTGNGTVSFALTTPSGNSVYYYSREAASNRPELIVETAMAGAIAPTQPPAPTASPAPTQAPAPTTTPIESGAATLSLAPVEDAVVRADSAGSNYGSAAYLRTRLSGSSDYDSYLKFEVPALPAGVSRATLRLYTYDGSPDGGTLFSVSNSLRGSSQPWTEGALTWKNAPALPNSGVASAGATNNNSWVSFDVTSVVKGSGVYSFGLSSRSTNSAFYYTKEAPSNRPMLVIELAGGVSRALAMEMQALSAPVEESAAPLVGLPSDEADDAAEAPAPADDEFVAPIEAPVEAPAPADGVVAEPTKAPAEALPTEVPVEAPPADEPVNVPPTETPVVEVEPPTATPTLDLPTATPTLIPPTEAANQPAPVDPALPAETPVVEPNIPLETPPPPFVTLPAPPSTGTQVVEAESASVLPAGSWTAHDTAEASGGRYVFSGGSPADTLTLSFSGATLEVVFVRHPALGSFNVEVDGAALLTVNSAANNSVFGERVAIPLNPGPHTVRIIPVEGTVALDAFVVEAAAVTAPDPNAPAPAEPIKPVDPAAPAEPVEPAPVEPAVPLNPTPTLSPDVAVVVQPAPADSSGNAPAPAQPLPTLSPDVAVPVQPAPAQPAPVDPAAPAAPAVVPLSLPVAEPFAAPQTWLATRDWIFQPQGGYSGSAWFADGRSRNDVSTLTAAQPIALVGVPQPELRFWQRASVAEGDRFLVELSTDGVNWAPLLQQVGQEYLDWQLQIVDLTPYSGQTVWLRFNYASLPGATPKNGEHGVWIDELSVAQMQPPPAEGQ